MRHQSLEQGQGHRQEEGPGADLLRVYQYYTMILYIFISCKIKYHIKYKKGVKGQTSVSDMRSVVGWSSLKTFLIRVMVVMMEMMVLMVLMMELPEDIFN